MFVINPLTGREISKDSRRFRDVEKTGVLNLSIRLPVECNEPPPTKGLESEKDTLSKYLKNGNYNRAFDYMFRTGEAIPANVVGNLLNALQGYRISFYSVKDSNFSTYIVSSSTKKHIIKNLIVPRSKYMALLGSFDKRDIMERAKSALSDRLRLKDEKKAAPLDEPKNEYIKNEATGRMIKVGSRKYKELFPDAKKAIGRPKKKWDLVVDLMEIAKKLDNLDGKLFKT